MDLSRLAEILGAYGADPERWPEAERSAALGLVRSSPHAAAIRDEAARLDRLLDRAPAPAPSPALIGAVLAAAERRPFWAGLRGILPFGPPWKPAAALAMAAVLGVCSGAATSWFTPANSPLVEEASVTLNLGSGG